MSKLVLCTYLKVLLEYRSVDEPGQPIVLGALFSALFDDEISFNKRDASYITRGMQGLPRYIKGKLSEINLRKQDDFFKRFESQVLPLLRFDRYEDISKVLSYIIFHDDDIKDTDCVDYISNITKSNVGADLTPTFIAGVFLYLLDTTNNDNNEDNANKIDSDYCQNAVFDFDTWKKQSTQNVLNDDINSDVIARANKFCIEFEKYRPLLPLCQIAFIVDQQHAHPNPMYTEYCCLPKSVRIQIMKSNEIPILKSHDRYDFYSLLGKFRKNVEDKDLSSRNRLYAIAQYVTKSFLYEKESIDQYDTCCFPCIPSMLFPNHTKSTLSRFIDDYLYIKDKDDSFPVPMDWLWIHFNLSTCPEQDIVFWLNWFIINACYSLLPELNEDTYVNNPYLYMSSNIESYVETMEDVHYLALLRLYELYYQNYNNLGE